MAALTIYIHIPFCVRKCAYCDFNAYSGLMDLRNSYVAALAHEIRSSPDAGSTISTIYFGGGTPTTLSGEQFEDILSALRDTFSIVPDAEISSEANPSTSDADQFEAMARAGINRLSIGIQSFLNNLLLNMDRNHSADEAIAAYQTARSVGFENISLDLMFATPGQTISNWEASLQQAIELAPQHLSVYGLTIEPGTRFERLHRGGKLDLPAESIEIEMFHLARTMLREAGYEHYEISNYAKPGYRCRHNLNYWDNGEYLGFGAGAVSYRNRYRWKWENQPGAYIQQVASGDRNRLEEESLIGEMAVAETAMLGLRMLDGFDPSRLNVFGGTDDVDSVIQRLDRLISEGLLEPIGDLVRLSEKGLIIANDVFLELLPE